MFSTHIREKERLSLCRLRDTSIRLQFKIGSKIRGMAGNLSLLVLCCMFAAAHSQSGDTGSTGPQGYTGATGPMGFHGYTGAAGQRGPPGPSGPSGPAGPPGVGSGGAGGTGATGPAGFPGVPGQMGPPGARGPSGEPGRDAGQMNSAEFERLLEEHNVDAEESVSDEDDANEYFKEHGHSLIIGLFVWVALLTVAFFFYVVFQCHNKPTKEDVLVRYSEILRRQNAQNNGYDDNANVENGKANYISVY